MKTLAIISQKGGSGKTTLAVHLAVAAELDGKSTVIVDLDPQASAAGWGDSRESDSPMVVTAPPARLASILDAARDNGAAAIIGSDRFLAICLVASKPDLEARLATRGDPPSWAARKFAGPEDAANALDTSRASPAVCARRLRGMAGWP